MNYSLEELEFNRLLKIAIFYILFLTILVGIGAYVHSLLSMLLN